LRALEPDPSPPTARDVLSARETEVMGLVAEGLTDQEVAQRLYLSPRTVGQHLTGCPDTVTPFNGEHRAGIKALSTRNFPDDRGPLREVAP